jgi:hypothetical protein
MCNDWQNRKEKNLLGKLREKKTDNSLKMDVYPPLACSCHGPKISGFKKAQPALMENVGYVRTPPLSPDYSATPGYHLCRRTEIYGLSNSIGPQKPPCLIPPQYRCLF